MKRPVIGLTLDSEPAGGYSGSPWYAIRENYCGAVIRAGGLPLLLPHEPECAAAYLDRIDGLVVTGGAFDVDPALFGAATRHETVTTKDRRTAFEKSATEGALARDMPVLGICGGQQLLNVVLGGTLITGGRGHFVGILGGALLFTALGSLLTGTMLPEAVRSIIYGLVLLGAIVALRERADA